MCPELTTILLDAYEAAPEGQSKVLADIYDEENLTRNIKATVKRAGVEAYGKPLHTLRKVLHYRLGRSIPDARGERMGWTRQHCNNPAVLSEGAGQRLREGGDFFFLEKSYGKCYGKSQKRQ
jgi:hypothetical protein